jgi:hypothetical protein
MSRGLGKVQLAILDCLEYGIDYLAAHEDDRPRKLHYGLFGKAADAYRAVEIADNFFASYPAARLEHAPMPAWLERDSFGGSQGHTASTLGGSSGQSVIRTALSTSASS